MPETYEAPRLTTVGSLAELTLGGGHGGTDDIHVWFLKKGPYLS